MNRRDFLKAAAATTAAIPFVGNANPAFSKQSHMSEGPQVSRRELPNTGISLPLLGYGMMRLPTAGNKIDYEKGRALVHRAMQAGLNYFDTAYMYHGGESEKFCGDVLSEFPRDSYYLASKLPCGGFKSEADNERVFNDQLQKCKTDYFDFYLLHNMNAGAWRNALDKKSVEFVIKMQEQGKIRKLGFSFHDRYQVLEDIASYRKWDFTLIQLNVFDWDTYYAKEQYEILTKLNIPVFVMEPLRGGRLAHLTPEATNILKAANPNASSASWAFRFVASLPNVACVLSGMTHMDHLVENIGTFSNFKPLDENEQKTLKQAMEAYFKMGAIPCTNCRYCVPCPAEIDIPRQLTIYNEYQMNKNKWQFKQIYNNIKPDSRADQCEECETCIKKCPQKINIPAELKKVAELYKSI
ncbi:MAG: twin-arginine translocation signal domain-containing protein [Lentisphaerae bacterium]|jgi:predicted aldo/keto reductase-like oxidoreductase|nr:twin-arginine translocation signal domain-containing protein [Lentisphaerota bacterium]